MYSVVQNNSSMFEFPALLPQINPMLPMHSPDGTCVTELSKVFCSTLYSFAEVRLGVDQVGRLLRNMQLCPQVDWTLHAPKSATLRISKILRANMYREEKISLYVVARMMQAS